MSRTIVPMLCAHCGICFQRPPSRIQNGRGKHCSRTCQYAAKRNAPRKGKAFKCENCRTEFILSPAQMLKSGSGRYCSRPCRDSHWRGVASPHWQGGNGVYKRGSHWQAIKRAVRKRDCEKCQNCGEHSNLHVHHIIPFRMFDDEKDANEMGNLITLCAPCHRIEDAKWKWIKMGHGCLRFSAKSEAWKMAKTMFFSKMESGL